MANILLKNVRHILLREQAYRCNKKADAIIVCNPDGYIGTRTLYEIGYADSQNKRIIFLYNEYQDFDICFPRDYGLLGFDL